MNTKKLMENLANTPVSRREFLWRAGVLLMALTGISSILKVLQQQTGTNPNGGQTYGASSYGSKSVSRRHL